MPLAHPAPRGRNPLISLHPFLSSNPSHLCALPPLCNLLPLQTHPSLPPTHGTPSYCRRQWSLGDTEHLRYSQLGAFDRAMMELDDRWVVVDHSPSATSMRTLSGLFSPKLPGTEHWLGPFFPKAIRHRTLGGVFFPRAIRHRTFSGVFFSPKLSGTKAVGAAPAPSAPYTTCTRFMLLSTPSTCSSPAALKGKC